MTETTQSERERLLDMPVDNIVHSLCRDADRLARAEETLRQIRHFGYGAGRMCGTDCAVMADQYFDEVKMTEIDVRKEIDEFRFADGEPGENNVCVYDGYLVINGDGRQEVEIQTEDVDNLIEALRRAKECESDGPDYPDGPWADGWETRITGKDEARESIRRIQYNWGPEYEILKIDYPFDWIKHDGSKTCPTHPLDILEYDQGTYLKNEYNIPANKIIWNVIEYYRHKKDEDGVPYCSNETLEKWAEYVASDADGEAWQFENCPIAEEHGEWWANCKFTRAPHHDNTFQHWTETLRRVYRDPADDRNYRMGT